MDSILNGSNLAIASLIGHGINFGLVLIIYHRLALQVQRLEDRLWDLVQGRLERLDRAALERERGKNGRQTG